MIIDPFSPVAGSARSPERSSVKTSARILAAMALAGSLFCFQGCGGDRDLPPEFTKAAVKIDEVPDQVRDAAKKAIPGVEFKEAWKNLDRERKLHSYEIRGKNATTGKIREVRVSIKGEILEME
jgi:hypothetical protein